jgi:hypothetical protein
VKVDLLLIDKETAGRRAILDRSKVSNLATRKGCTSLHIIFMFLLYRYRFPVL